MLPTLRGEQSGYYQYQLKTNKTQSPQKGLFCPFIVAHFFRSVKNRRNICYVKNAVRKFLTALFIATTVARSRKLPKEKHVAEQEEQAR